MKVRTLYNISEHGCDIEHPSLDDCRVVPNCALTVAKILHKFESGTFVNAPDSRYYDDVDVDIDKPVVSYNDLTDLSDNSSKISTLLNNIKGNQSNKAE